MCDLELICFAKKSLFLKCILQITGILTKIKILILQQTFRSFNKKNATTHQTNRNLTSTFATDLY